MVKKGQPTHLWVITLFRSKSCLLGWWSTWNNRRKNQLLISTRLTLPEYHLTVKTTVFHDFPKANHHWNHDELCPAIPATDPNKSPFRRGQIPKNPMNPRNCDLCDLHKIPKILRHIHSWSLYLPTKRFLKQHFPAGPWSPASRLGPGRCHGATVPRVPRSRLCKGGALRSPKKSRRASLSGTWKGLNGLKGNPTKHLKFGSFL